MNPTWDDRLVAVHQAETLEELWTVLLVTRSFRTTLAWEEAYALFQRFHADDPEGAATTALLLCTDERWSKAANGLVQELARSGMLDDDALDELADAFVDPVVRFAVDAELFDGPALEIELSRPGDDDRETAPPPSPPLDDAGDGDEDRRVGVTRWVPPPLRRWGAARLVDRHPATWRAVVERASALPSRHAAMALAGVMDAAGSVAEAERAEVVDLGVAATSGIARLAALPALAELRGVDAALAVAATDPSARVREWAARWPSGAAAGDDGDADSSQAGRRRRPAHRADDPPTLF